METVAGNFIADAAFDPAWTSGLRSAGLLQPFLNWSTRTIFAVVPDWYALAATTKGISAFAPAYCTMECGLLLTTRDFNRLGNSLG